MQKIIKSFSLYILELSVNPSSPPLVILCCFIFIFHSGLVIYFCCLTGWMYPSFSLWLVCCAFILHILHMMVCPRFMSTDIRFSGYDDVVPDIFYWTSAAVCHPSEWMSVGILVCGGWDVVGFRWLVCIVWWYVWVSEMPAICFLDFFY